jgi:hypothetical protein
VYFYYIAVCEKWDVKSAPKTTDRLKVGQKQIKKSQEPEIPGTLLDAD